jgi:hypothetical protein
MTSPSQNSEILTLPVALTIRTVQATKDAVLAGLSSGSEIILDVPEDAECDLSLIQVVESARMFAQTHDKGFSLQGPASGGLYTVLERGGFLTDMDPSDRFFWLHERQI